MIDAMATARPSRPVLVRDLLVSAVPGLRDRMLEETIRIQWATIAGPDAARRSRPGELRGGVLNVVVDNSPWLQEISLRSNDLLSALRARHGNAVTAVKCGLGTVPTMRPAARERSASRRERLTAEEEQSLDAITAAVADPEIAHSVRRVVAKDIIARRGRASAPPARRLET